AAATTPTVTEPPGATATLAGLTATEPRPGERLTIATTPLPTFAATGVPCGVVKAPTVTASCEVDPAAPVALKVTVARLNAPVRPAPEAPATRNELALKVGLQPEVPPVAVQLVMVSMVAS